MAGPATPAEAADWAREAIATGRYWLVQHAENRMASRRLSLADIKNVLLRSTGCSPYEEGKISRGGACWRIAGQDLDGDQASIGVELYRDHLGKACLVITVF